VDPTGGGNTFLGALAIGMTGAVEPSESVIRQEILDGITGESRSAETFSASLLLGLVHATVAAGFAIEQSGMPALSHEIPDLWNGERYPDRFRAYVTREKDHMADQLRSMEQRTA